MADIPDTKLVSSLAAVAGQPEQNREKRPPFKERPKRPPRRESISDVIYIMGIPAGEVTDKVREAISLIVNELDYMREQLKFANEKIEKLEELSEKHFFLPMLNHRGLLRELARVLIHKERTGAEISFLFISIQGIEDIKRLQGLKAAQMALASAARTIASNVLETDIVGSLGGNDIGVILTIAGRNEALRKADELIKALQDNDDGFRLLANAGVHAALAGETAAAVIEAADEDLRGGLENGEKRRRRLGQCRRQTAGRRREDGSGDDIG